MSAEIIAQAALAIGKPITDYFVGKEQNKLDLENQRHRNEVSAISSALQRNQTTLQEIDVADANRQVDQSVQLRALEDAGSAEVASAAAGVRGGSVQAVMRGLKRSELTAQFNRIENVDNQMQALGQQRRNINVSQILSKDNTVLPAPSFGALLLGVGTAAYDVYSSNKKP